MAKNPIQLFTLESKIKRQLREHLKSIGYIKTKGGFLKPDNDSKEFHRTLHAAQREENLLLERQFVNEKWSLYSKYFADGKDVIPNKIKPRLEMIEGGTWQSELFRMASLTWSVPVSKGYGRRLRFLVWDDSNEKLMGLIGLSDPVFNMKVRDSYVGWDSNGRRKRLVNVLDAFVLGAMPPYNQLLCGKLMACLIRTKDVKDYFHKKYADTRGIISGKKKKAALVLVTTSSALGKSAVYNRLKLGGQKYFKPIGYTSGWGHFHIPKELFSIIREYLRRQKQKKQSKYSSNYKFGEGPNWKLRSIRLAFSLLGLNQDLLRHGILREVFVCELASNAKKILNGQSKKPRYSKLMSVEQVGNLALERWILPRSLNRPDYVNWDKQQILNLITSEAIEKKLTKIG